MANFPAGMQSPWDAVNNTIWKPAQLSFGKNGKIPSHAALVISIPQSLVPQDTATLASRCPNPFRVPGNEAKDPAIMYTTQANLQHSISVHTTACIFHTDTTLVDSHGIFGSANCSVNCTSAHKVLIVPLAV